MIGISLKANSCALGCEVRLLGRSVWALSIASFTFNLASSVFTSVSNSIMIKLKSVCDVLVIFLTLAPLIPFNCFSIGLVTRFSISFGELPTYTVVTLMVGTTISGNCSLGIVLNLYNPNSVIRIAII